MTAHRRDCVGEPGVLGTFVAVPRVSVWQGGTRKPPPSTIERSVGSSGPSAITEIPSAEKAHWQLNRTAIDGRHEWRTTGIHPDVEPRTDQGPRWHRGFLPEGQLSEEGRDTHTVDAPEMESSSPGSDRADARRRG